MKFLIHKNIFNLLYIFQQFHHKNIHMQKSCCLLIIFTQNKSTSTVMNEYQQVSQLQRNLVLRKSQQRTLGLINITLHLRYLPKFKHPFLGWWDNKIKFKSVANHSCTQNICRGVSHKCRHQGYLQIRTVPLQQAPAAYYWSFSNE